MDSPKSTSVVTKIVRKPQIIPRSEHGVSRSDISENALKVLYRLKNSGYQAYLVGGGVRDILIGLKPKDFDVATDAHPEQVRELFRNCRLIGRRFRLAHVHFGREIIEVSTFRASHNDAVNGEGHEEDGRIIRDNVYGKLDDDVWRRDRFGFNKVTAVSTTGFSEEANIYAGDKGIELRTVKELTPEDISSWFQLEHMTLTRRIADLKYSKLLISPDSSADVIKAMKEIIHSKKDEPILESTKTGEYMRAVDVFLGVVQQNNWFDYVNSDNPTKNIQVTANYPDNSDHYIVETGKGKVRITQIYFDGTLRIKNETIPVGKIAEYTRNENDEAIAQVASFSLNVQGKDVSLEFHNLSETGETHVLLRKKEKEK